MKLKTNKFKLPKKDFDEKRDFDKILFETKKVKQFLLQNLSEKIDVEIIELLMVNPDCDFAEIEVYLNVELSKEEK